MNARGETGKALRLCLLAGANYLLFYGLGVFLARVLGVKGFGYYSFVVATLTMLASMATVGLEKYALRVLPSYIDQGRWDHANGFALFSLVTIYTISVAGAVAFVVWNWWSHEGLRINPWVSVTLFVAFVSSMALVMFLVEMLSAAGNAVLATVAYRLFLPLSAVGLVCAVFYLSGGITVRRAIICYGVSWVFALVVMFQISRKVLPAEIWKAGSIYDSRHWLRRAMPFFLQSFMMTQFASSGVIVLEILRSSDADIAIYAASMQVAGFAVLLATATNRFYAPMASIMLDRKDWDGIMRAKEERHGWVNPTILAFLVVILLFGRRIMGLYGPEFEDGYLPLSILAVGTAASVKYAMAPYVLQFFGKARWVLGTICIAGACNLALLVILGKLFGAVGAAIAYTTSLGAMSLAMYLKGLHLIREKKTEGNNH